MAKRIPTLGRKRRTCRGFGIIKFKDCYDIPCSLQVSSSVEPSIWLGTADAQPRILASQARAFGVQTTESTGWVPYPIPNEVLLSTRMHLRRKQVIALIADLQQWVNEGVFSRGKSKSKV